MPKTIDESLHAYLEAAQVSAQIVKKYTEHKDPEMKAIAIWLTTNVKNPHTIFLQDGDAYRMSNIFGVESLLSEIHHALVDDGSICFPVVNGRPYISFYDRWDLTERPEIIAEAVKPSSMKKVSYLPSVEAFIEAADEYAKTTARNCFIIDAARHGMEFSMRGYMNRPEYEGFFTQDWLEGEAKEAIEERAVRYAKFNMKP